jgi:copper chaperone CopZ
MADTVESPATSHTYDIRGMHCQSCVRKVTEALRGVAGVADATVTLAPPGARVELSRPVATAELQQAVARAGEYRIVESSGLPGLPVVTAPSSVASAPRVAARHQEDDAPRESLYPLFLIVAYIAGTVGLVALATGERSPQELMRHFMGGFFLVFSFFKLLDLRGFADAYRMYDVVARRAPAWGLVYPFVELALGAAYVVNASPLAVNVVTLVLMLVGSFGVLQALLAKRTIRCACLGTALNLPMTKVTLVEDLTMAAMAAAMLAMG